MEVNGIYYETEEDYYMILDEIERDLKEEKENYEKIKNADTGNVNIYKIHT